MVQFEIKPILKDYFYASYLRLKHRGLRNAFQISLFGSFIMLAITSVGNTRCFMTSINDCIKFFLISFFFQLIIFTILIFIFTICLSFILIPLLKFYLARFYYKQGFIRYFFDKDYIGWEIGGNKLSYKIELIEYIKIYPNYLLIQLKMKKINLIFLAEKTVIKNVVEKLKKTNYKKYLIL
ncbi:MAG: hypothetical protein WC894_02645 [Patescibacteria group bacterium]